MMASGIDGSIQNREGTTMNSPRIFLGLTLLVWWCAGCGGSSGSGPGTGKDVPAVDLWPSDDGSTLTTAREGCDILAGETRPGGDFIFALTEEVRPDRAPVPHNISERIVFAQLYETLVQVDCEGRAHPGLAELWTCTDDSTTWIFTLREGARFWDGTRVTADEVVQAWGESQESLGDQGPTSPLAWLNARAETLSALDARRLAVRLPEPHARFPMLMAHPATAVSVRRLGWTWPVGSGPGRLRASDPAPMPDLRCLPNVHHPGAPTWKSLTFAVTPGLDPRDLVATDMDLTLVRDMDVVGFFKDAPGFDPIPLPYSRLYLLICPPQMNPEGSTRWLQAAAHLDPARDVTAVAARSWPEIVFPAGGDSGCPQLSGPVPGAESARLDWNLAAKNLDTDVLAYPGDDPGAREIARRLGALAGGSTRTASLIDGSLEFALQWQMAGAFVLPVAQQFPTGCLQMAALLGQAAWLQKVALDLPEQATETLAAADQNAAKPRVLPAQRLTELGIVTPLGVSRSWLVTRGSLAGLSLAFDGTPLLAGLGQSSAPTPAEGTP